jgi:SAM-dependent methyltransferase
MAQAWLRRNRQRIERELAHSPNRHLFSPAYYAQYRVMAPMVRQFAVGRIIDLGCGDMPFRDLAGAQATVYHGLDRFPRSSDVTFCGDIQDMGMLADESYDAAICLDVLEHVPDPCRALRETSRILAPGGLLILSVPHLSRLHDEPHDYYRYTRHGLRYLLESQGFIVVRIEKRGGLFCFLGHQISTLLLCSVWSIPVLKQIVWFLNSRLFVAACYMLDEIADRAGIYAMGYGVVARKAPCHAQSRFVSLAEQG